MSDEFLLQPLALHRIPQPGDLPLAGGPLRYSACDVILRQASHQEPIRETRLLSDLPFGADRQLKALTAPRADFAGLSCSQPQVMGIINATPDSFSDGGDRYDAGRAVADGLAMVEAGASLVDVGGESTRPGAEPVGLEEELRRTIPVVKALADQGVKVSIDTRHGPVMAEAAAAGAAAINDVTALSGDEDSLRLAAETGLPVYLMHMQGSPQTMQQNPSYVDVSLEVRDYLAGRLEACQDAGIPLEKLAVDPGIGFGKSLAHNLELMDRLALLHGLGVPLLLGASRKSFIGKLSKAEAPKDRLPGSLAAVLAGVARGVQFFRVHDVAETVQALRVWEAMDSGGL
ncbi:dihydropteroate synthase [Rhodovibrionaceae bacterium A322]